MNYGKLLTLLVMAFTLSGSMNAEDLTLKITKKYLNLPVSHQKERAVMTLAVDGKPVRSFDIRLASGEPDYWVFCDVSSFKGKQIKISYRGDAAGMDKIRQMK